MIYNNCPIAQHKLNIKFIFTKNIPHLECSEAANRFDTLISTEI